jgi:hypothetical protein
MLINRSFKVVESDVFVGSGLIDMYAKCGSMGDALRIFNKMTPCNVVSWNAMIAKRNVGKGRRHWNYFNKCNGKVWTDAL